MKTIVNILENELDYDVQYKVLNALDYGVAQKRKRMFLVGTKKDIIFNYPKKIKGNPVLRDALKDVPESEGTTYSRKKDVLLTVSLVTFL